MARSRLSTKTPHRLSNDSTLAGNKAAAGVKLEYWRDVSAVGISHITIPIPAFTLIYTKEALKCCNSL